MPSSASPTTPKPQRAVQSIEVGGQLLLALAGSHGPLGLKDLAALAGLPSARAHPYLVSFGKLGLVEQRADTGYYALGPAALQLGLTCLHQLDPIRVAWPIVQELATRTGHAAALAVWGNFGPTIVRMVEARQPLHVSMRAGTVMSILGTATGRAFAAALPAERVHRALQVSGAQPLGADNAALAPAPKPTARQTQALREAVAEVRARGVARALGRPMPGVNAFSAPVFDHEGDVALVITLLGHQDHVAADWDGPAAKAVCQAAAQVSAHLGSRVAAAPAASDAPVSPAAPRSRAVRAAPRAA